MLVLISLGLADRSGQTGVGEHELIHQRAGEAAQREQRPDPARRGHRRGTRLDAVDQRPSCSVDRDRPGDESRRDRACLGDLLQHIDAIIAAEEFPSALTGHEDLGRALEVIGRDSGASLVCVTLGERGSLAWCNGREIRTPPFQVDCVDSTGAGDVFRGAFAAGCLAMPDGDIEDVLRYANAAAALNCRALGSRGALPSKKEVEQLAMDSGLDWVSLRPTVFATNFAGMWSAQIGAGDVVAGPYARASTAPIIESDISAVAARAPDTGPVRLAAGPLCT